MKTLIIGFSKPKSNWAIGSFLIRLFEKCDFSHAFIRWHSESLDRDLIYQASHGMVHFISGSKFDDSVTTVTQYTFDLTPIQSKNIVQKCIDLAGTKYGTLQLFGMAFERITGIRNPFRDGSRTYVCSELVGEVLKQIHSIDLDLEYIGPKELKDLVSKIATAISE